MKPVLEGILFLVGEEGISLEELSNVLELEQEETLKLIDELENDYQDSSRGLTIKTLGGMYKLTTKKEHKEYYTKLTELDSLKTLSQSALETLAIIAYNEPITRSEVDELRGVSSAQMIRNLVAKDFIKEVGRSEKIGRPILYGITSEFLDYFGLNSKDELPEIEVIEEAKDDVDLYDSKYKEDEVPLL